MKTTFKIYTNILDVSNKLKYKQNICKFRIKILLFFKSWKDFVWCRGFRLFDTPKMQNFFPCFVWLWILSLCWVFLIIFKEGPLLRYYHISVSLLCIVSIIPMVFFVWESLTVDAFLPEVWPKSCDICHWCCLNKIRCLSLRKQWCCLPFYKHF